MHHEAWLSLIVLCGLSAETFAQQPPSQSFEVDVPVALAPVRSEGRELVAYELHLTNFDDETLTLKDIRISDAVSARPVATYAGDDLSGRMKLVGRAATSPAPRAIEPGQRAIVFVELDLPSDESVRALKHEIDFETTDGTVRALTLAAMAIHGAEVPVLGAPLRAGLWVAVHDPRWPRGHRRVTYAIDGKAKLPGRFAVDWVGIDANGALTHGDGDRPADAIGYGAQVLAGADATVAGVRDGMAESASIKANKAHALGEGAGNYVALEIAPKRYAFYEHLRPGSVRVRVGERVRKGEVIGALGFSGDTTGPHLHLHVADCADPLACEGMPFEVEGMTELGRYDDLSTLGSKPWRAAERGQLAPEWPGSNIVVRFR